MSLHLAKTLLTFGFITVFASACRSSSGGSDGGGGPSVLPTPTQYPGSSSTSTGPITTTSLKMPITITAQGPGQLADVFEVNKADLVTINFTITGPSTPSAVLIGLAASPTGGTLQNATTLSPTFSWSASSAILAESTLTLVVRDLAACQQVLGTAAGAQCSSSTGTTSLLVANSQYDETKTFTIRVKDFTGSTSGSLLTALIGLLQGGGGIQSILPLLQQISPALASQLSGGNITLSQLLTILLQGTTTP